MIALAFSVLTPVVAVEPADAATASDWDAGYIVDDAVFYDSGSMSATDVQAFLNTKVTNCVSGYTCLNAYGQATGPIAGDRYCNGYQAAAFETAAQIIDNVARSCGISQRALLVLLEKEQGLVTARAPSDRAYRAATGMACPDTAPCDPNFSGFFYQVYYGARQFEIYRLNPGNYVHRAGQLNNVRFSPNAACGTKSVFIYNQATAGLYNYTPYTPNDAALANLYGAAPAGEQCSTYGNRNFWRLFTDWFGNPRTYVVLDGFASYWSSRGGASGQIGQPISYAIYVEQNGQGWYQRFQGGTLYGSFFGGTVFVANNAILAEYNRQGGPYGAMGFPKGEQYCSTGTRCGQSFVGAEITTTPAYGAHVVWGGMRDYWLTAGGLNGSLGAALNDMVYSTPAAGVGWQQNFESGVLVQSNSGFQLVPYSLILNSWNSAGAGASALGWPSGPYSCGASGCAQQFRSGFLASSPYGVQQITGGFIGEWITRGGITGALGTAYGPLRYSPAAGTGYAQNFAGGILTQSSSGFIRLPYGGVQALWSASNEAAGTYGWPAAEQVCDDVGCIQAFSGGLISDSTWGRYGSFGNIAAEWKSLSATSSLGPALNDLRYSTASGGGWAQHFGKGVITQTQSTNAMVFTPYGPIVNAWYRYGAENTWLGWPTGPQNCTAGSCQQQFQNGVARSDPSGGVSFTSN